MRVIRTVFSVISIVRITPTPLYLKFRNLLGIKVHKAHLDNVARESI